MTWIVKSIVKNLSKRSQRLTPSTPRPTSQRTKLTVKTRNLRREKHPPWEDILMLL